ncbi:MAG: GNAT family N-acetyltransferase, partial [Dehalococcoidia bacterium]
MTVRSGAWVVDGNGDFDLACAVLSRDRIANAYALCDLEPPFDRYTTVAVAACSGEAAAACLVVRHPEFTGIVTYGHAEGVHAALGTVDLPAVTHVDLPAGHRPIVERFYAFTQPRQRRVMAVNAGTFRPVSGRPRGLVRLGVEDYTRLVDLYAEYEDGVFYRAQLEQGVFYGVQEGDCLVAAGGTVGMARKCGIAVVADVFTRPEARRRGFGMVVTSAITAECFALGCWDVSLDVNVTNGAAIRTYERLGFRAHSRRW